MNAASPLKRIHVIQGEFAVASDPDVVYSTLLGSCVAACILDPERGVGGINHFLLPGDAEDRHTQDGERLGAHLLELLVNGLMKAGARRDRLRAKLFGGARVVRGLSDIGKRNSEFAERYLAHEGIDVVAKDVGGESGRRLQFWPTTGRARVSYLPTQIDDARTPYVVKLPKAGEIELFN